MNLSVKGDEISKGTRFIWNSGASFACESYMRAKFSSRAVAIAFICCAVTVATWFSVQWWRQHNPQDFEQCSEQAASSKDERIALMAQCTKLFAGRRKIGGGYTYYDFLQDRHFDMAGPNPTPEELKYFDEQYALYLEAQRHDAVAAVILEKQSGLARPDFQDDRVTGSSTSPPELPMTIAPTHVPIPRARSSVVRSKNPCEDASLSCNWTKFSAEIMKFFESNAKVNRP
jgi:hypothetical protein